MWWCSMKETIGDIFDYLTDPETDAICIFTNGITNKNGQAMAGAGQAGAAASRWWNFRDNLGNHIVLQGNTPGIVGSVSWFKTGDGSTKESTMLIPSWVTEKGKPYIVSFPTKDHFKDLAIPSLIERSARKLIELADKMQWKKVIMGRPGCGTFTGRLGWETEVKPLIEKLLDDRFLIITKD